MCVEVLERYGRLLSTPFHCYHWTHHGEMLARMRESFRKEDAGVSVPRSARQDKEMEQAAACVGRDFADGFWQQEALRGIPSKPGYPVIAMQAIASMLADRGDEIMVNMRAPGSVGNLQGDGIVLISARFFRDGPRPLRFEGVPDGIAPLTRQILDYQKALVHAAVEGSRRDLEVAFLMDPMMRDMKTVRAMLDELLEANKGCIRPELSQW
jgi:alpha-galactosidase/6-phospho-beta-glucosidase family protein